MLIKATITSVEPMGDGLVLKLVSPCLQKRFASLINSGATYDYDRYIPHISLSYDSADLKDNLELPDLPRIIQFDREYFENLILD